jgi:hypothetical protein
LEEYRESLEFYCTAVSDLAEARPRVTRDAYLRLARYTEEARHKMEQARLALERHASEHCC